MPETLTISAEDIRFAADAHFKSRSIPGETERRELFIRFLGTLPGGSALILLGDIFDFYFEYRSVVSNRYIDLYRALIDCRSRGVSVHFLGGNHDYWVGDFFERDLGITTHTDEMAVAAQGRKIVCAHGDLVIPRDPGYKILKTIIRNRFVIGVSRWIHPDVMSAIATCVSTLSRNVKKSSQEERARWLAEIAPTKFYGRGNDIFVMGHVHYPLHHVHDGREFLIVGDWVTNFTYGRLCGGKLSLERFTDSSTD
jgi:UDP-2,3-diacylglucosamine hydrolase